MKINILTFFAGMIVLFSGCEMSKSLVSARLISNSGCKSSAVNADKPNLAALADSLSCVDYKYNVVNKTLTMLHRNAGFNCCPGQLSCKAHISNDTIYVQEFEKKSGCKCQCLYDLNIELTGVKAGAYQIEFIEPYLKNQEKISFELDLNNEIVNSYCVVRTNYPWNK